MSQHFLLSTRARTLSLAKVMRLTDGEAYEAFKSIRWADTDGEPVCPALRLPFSLRVQVPQGMQVPRMRGAIQHYDGDDIRQP